MKLSVARIFEVSQVATTKAFEELRPFFEYFNLLTDNLVRVLVNGVGVRDNLDAQVLTVTLRKDTPQSIRTNKQPAFVLLARQIPRRPLVSAFAWDIDNDGSLRVEASFDDTDTSTLEVTIIAIFS